MLETYRGERLLLQDVFDLPALKLLLGRLQAARTEIDLVDVETATASPFASSQLLFDYIASVHVRGRHAAGGAACARRRSRSTATCSRELLPGQEELRELIDPNADALAEVEASLRPFPTDAEAACTICCGCAATLRSGEFDEAHAAILEAERRAIRVRIAGEERLAAAEDAGRYRDALGIVPPSGLPAVFIEPVEDALLSLVARWARRGRGPFTTGDASAWFGVDVEEELRRLERDEKLVRGELRPGGTEREWCDADVLRRLRRASLAALRREVEPVEQAALGRFLPSWHGIGRRASLREAIVPLQSLAPAGGALGVGGVAAARARVPAPSSSTPSGSVGRARVGRSRA